MEVDLLHPIEKGRCSMEETPRQDREVRTYRLLDQLNIPYTRIDHAPAMTMEDCLAVDQALADSLSMSKVDVVRDAQVMVTRL